MVPDPAACARGSKEDSGKEEGVVRSASEEARRMSQWQKQIDFGKNTLGYQTYQRLVPREARRRDDPQTPEIRRDISKKRFDGQLRAWRRALHKYDDPEALEATEVLQVSGGKKQENARKRRNEGTPGRAGCKEELHVRSSRNRAAWAGPKAPGGGAKPAGNDSKENALPEGSSEGDTHTTKQAGPQETSYSDAVKCAPLHSGGDDTDDVAPEEREEEEEEGPNEVYEMCMDGELDEEEDYVVL